MTDIRSDDRLTEYYGSFNWSRSTFTVHLRRKYLYYVIHLILPYFLFCLIAMSSLLLQPSRPERITLEMTILLTLSVYQLMIRDQLPKKSGAVPLLGIYFLFVMIMCFVSLATTIFIVYLHTHANSVPPAPLSPRARRLICQRLANLLSFRTTQPCVVDGTSEKSRPVTYRDGNTNRGHTSQRATVSDNQALINILDLLETRISVEEGKDEKSDKDAKRRRDWMLAAAVIDRLCFIALIIIYIAGTLVFLIMFSLS